MVTPVRVLYSSASSALRALGRLASHCHAIRRWPPVEYEHQVSSPNQIMGRRPQNMERFWLQESQGYHTDDITGVTSPAEAERLSGHYHAFDGADCAYGTRALSCTNHRTSFAVGSSRGGGSSPIQACRSCSRDIRAKRALTCQPFRLIAPNKATQDK